MRESRNLELKETVDTNSFLKTISAYANFGDGKIIFGIRDDGTILGIEHPVDACLRLENKINDAIKPLPSYTLDINEDQTITLNVLKGPYTPYFYKGKTYKRNDSATIEVDRLELNRLILEGSNQTYEEQPSSIQDLTFSQLGKEFFQKKGVETITPDILKTLGLMDKNTYNHAAALIADENRFPGVDLVRYGRNINELMERQTYDHMSVFRMYHQAMEMYRKYYCYEKIEGSQRVQKEMIPKEAFREALANALVHRTWDIQTRIRISMDQDKIEITSPGGLPAGISEAEYLDGQISFLRNPILGNIFFRLAYIEMFGSGIKRIKEAYAPYQASPEFKTYDNSITVVLPVSDTVIETSTDEKTILSNLSSSTLLSRSQLEERTGFSKAKTVRLLHSLSSKGLVQKSGSGMNTKYRIFKK
ncbi:ATP-binding protein [uncultured Dubosiella sp.]|uniref:ATP-binding protein n=1 Tax=uncultured Dubosiella sp. TaxID=1937011 RepID=UPI002730D183|nr:ATP-binding protein [uncultured Dubosiella sp.]